MLFNANKCIKKIEHKYLSISQVNDRFRYVLIIEVLGNVFNINKCQGKAQYKSSNRILFL